MMASLAACNDVTRLRLIGSILAFDVKEAGGYGSERAGACATGTSRTVSTSGRSGRRSI